MVCEWCGKEIKESDRHKYITRPYHMRCIGPAAAAQLRYNKRMQSNGLSNKITT